jgi:TldD protein
MDRGHDDYDTAVTDTSLIDPDVLERVLSTALVGGGDMAEVFRRGRRLVECPARRPPGRAALLGPVARRGDPGRRRRDHRLRPHGRPERGRAPRGRPGCRRGGPPGWQPGCAPWPSTLDVPRAGRAHPPDSVDKATQARAAHRADEAARAAGDAITQVQVGCGDSRRRILIANSEGLLAEDEQIRTRFNVMCVANGDTGMQTGYESLARTEGYEIFERHNVEDIARWPPARALAKLSARPAPSGEVPIVLAGGSGGILFHEACGHGLEADHIVKDASVYAGRSGSWWPARWSPWSTTARCWGSGATSPSTTRDAPRLATC